MRQWLPDERDLESDELYLDLDWSVPGRPGVALGMVIGLDGGVTIDGTSGALGAEGDKAAFRALRSAADVILVGAGTARAEDYGPPRRRDDVVARRTAAGRRPVPRLAIVTGRLEVDTDGRLFDDPENPPLFVTSRRAARERADAVTAAGGEVLVHGDEHVDLAGAVAALDAAHGPRILCEGGPRLNGDLLAAGLVRETFVTLAPVVTGSSRHLVSGDLPAAVDLRLVGVVRVGSELLLRHAVAG